jgi:hypothetical protein
VVKERKRALHSSPKPAQDLIFFSLAEFGCLRLPDELFSGSSIMPQKKNPCMLELLRAETASVCADGARIKEIIRALEVSDADWSRLVMTMGAAVQASPAEISPEASLPEPASIALFQQLLLEIRLRLKDYLAVDEIEKMADSAAVIVKEQKEITERTIAKLEAEGICRKHIVTEVAPLKTFYPTEDYHQDFIRHNPRHPYIVYWDAPLKRGAYRPTSAASSAILGQANR